MKTVYFVRHAQSGANAGGIRRGAATPLSPTGKRQAGIIAERCTHLSFEAIISSPQVRTEETAKEIARVTGKSVEYSDLFVEWKRPSAQEGITKHDPEMRHIDREMMEHIHIEGWRHSDEETFSEMNERVAQCLEFLEHRPESSLLVVTHGIFLRALLGRVLFGGDFTGSEFRRLYYGVWVSNTGIFKFRWDEGDAYAPWRLMVWNDDTHLG